MAGDAHADADRSAAGPVTRSALPRKPVQLVYIVGHHKSGATALGTVLAQRSSVFFAGELYRLPVPLWIPGDERRFCSCGLPVLRCPFWSALRSGVGGENRWEALRAGQRRYESWGRIFSTLRASKKGEPGLRRHAQAMVDLLDHLAELAGAATLIESSYSALRGYLYPRAANPRLDVRYLHLVRDGRGFLWSEMTARRGPGGRTRWIRFPPFIVLRWLGMNLLSKLLCGQDPHRYLRVRYEDFVTNPRATLVRIGAFLNMDFTEVAAQVESGTPIPLRHLAAGNRVRLLGSLVLAADRRWEGRLPRAAEALFWGMAGWLAWSYGYRRGARTIAGRTGALAAEEEPAAAR